MNKKSKVILTYGTFDLFHIGHLKLLERAKNLGDYLVVGVSTDDFNSSKNKRSFMPYEHRSQIVAAVRHVDAVIPEVNWEQKIDDIKKYEVDTFCIGDDWQGKFDFLDSHCNVEYLPRSSGIDSTSIRALARVFDSDLISRLSEAHSILDDLVGNFHDAKK